MSIVLNPAVRRLIELALEEDCGRGDVTSNALVDVDETSLRAQLVARQPLVVYGAEVAAEVFRRVDRQIAVEIKRGDGTAAEAGDVILVASGSAHSILVAERTALNFIQRLCGVATLSREFAERVSQTSARVVDTRKTTPGHRVLEKAAVAAGGCGNHRADLASGILIKDNHIAACGSVTAAVKRALERAPHCHRVEVEVTSHAELDEAIAAGAHVVLLDNMSVTDVARAVERAHAAGLVVEVSGGITLETVADYANAGVDIISVGALTHSAPAADLALDFK